MGPILNVQGYHGASIEHVGPFPGRPVGHTNIQPEHCWARLPLRDFQLGRALQRRSIMVWEDRDASAYCDRSRTLLAILIQPPLCIHLLTAASNECQLPMQVDLHCWRFSEVGHLGGVEDGCVVRLVKLNPHRVYVAEREPRAPVCMGVLASYPVSVVGLAEAKPYGWPRPTRTSFTVPPNGSTT